MADQKHPFYGLLTALPASDSDVSGRAVALSELLNSVNAPENRRKLINAYWELTGMLVECHCRAFQEQSITQWVQSLDNSNQDAGNIALLRAGLSLATEKRRIAELKFLQHQQKFAEEMRINGIGKREIATTHPENMGTNQLPFPADYPLILPYDTKTSTLSQVGYRPLSGKAILLSKTIPLQFRTMSAYGDAFRAAQEYFSVLQESRNFVPSLLVSTFDQQITARIEYAHSIIEYNKQISDYIAETVSANISGRQLLSALIVLPKENAHIQPQIGGVVRTYSENTNAIENSIPILNEPRTLPQNTQPLAPYAAENSAPSNNAAFGDFSQPAPASSADTFDPIDFPRN